VWKTGFACRANLGWAVFLFLLAIWVATGSVLAAFAQSPTEPPREQREFRRLLPLTSFYSIPAPLPAGRPGELIRSEEFYEYQLPEGVSASRILYHSRSAGGTDVAASGVVLTPDQPPPPGGWPVIAWAHGFTGVARQCAPSLMRNLNEGPFLSMYVKLGYAVVATDYVGLGTDFRNASVDMQSNAADVIYSMAAARAAVPQLGRKWIAMGESAGGLAAVAVAGLESDIRDPGYLGAIAVSGVADAREFYEQLAQANSPEPLLFLAYGLQTLYPQFQASQILSKEALAPYSQIERSCAVNVSGREDPVAQMLRPGWEDNSFVRRFFARNTLGQKPAYGPLLIISSDADPAVKTGMTHRALTRMCKQHDTIQFHQYQSSDFAAVLGDSVRDQLTWIQARFAGRRASGNCP
jgi:alpha-beta hydrolase superfamily lysophospholipase